MDAPGSSRTLAGLAFAWASALLPAAFPARALDPGLEVVQYAHTAWTARDGSFRGSIVSIAQTTDGYLWLGTGFGLLRYDGARFAPWEPPAGSKLPGKFVAKVFGSRDGSLWIGGEGLARWKDGKLRHYPELDGVAIFALVEDRRGVVWVGGSRRPTTRLCSIAGERVDCVGDRGEHGEWVRALHVDRGDRLWVGSATGVWRWSPGPPRHFPDSGSASVPRAIVEDGAGEILVARDEGLRRVVGDRIEAYPFPAGAGPVPAFSLLRDRDGALWIGTDREGLVHLSRGRLDRFGPAEGLSAGFAIDLFEDREGSVWAATLQGLDRFRPFSVPTITARQGLASDHVRSVLATRDGSLWVGGPNGLDRLLDGRIRRYGRRDGLPGDDVNSLFEDRRGNLWVSTLATRGVARLRGDRFVAIEAPAPNVFQFAEDREGDLWLTDREAGLLRIDPVSGRVKDTFPSSLLEGNRALSIAADPRRGGIWMGTSNGLLAYFDRGRIAERYGAAQGLGAGQVRDLRFDATGALWAATQGGLTRIEKGKVRTLDRAGGLPCDTVHWLSGLDTETVWLYADCGLLSLPRSELAAWVENPRHRVAVRDRLDHTDGVENVFFNTYYTPYATTARDGRVYFATTGGVSVLDPKNLARNRAVPRVFVERLTADGVAHAAEPAPVLPPLTREVRLDYTATSLALPQKVRFRHRLEGYDDGWQEAEGRREAFYRDLPPGDYRFRVIAANDSGVWNEEGATLAFSIRPAFHQTRTFLALVAGLLALAAWGLYRLRVRQVTGRLAARYEERIAERTRIAQELHDTLLQGFLAASMQLSAAVGAMAPDAPERSRLDRVLELVRRMIGEGRSAVLGLRSGGPEGEDLEGALSRVPEELGSPGAVAFRIETVGAPRPLREIARHEIYRIGREALANAYLHAGPSKVEVEIEHGKSAFKLRVRDDGSGFDPKEPAEEAGKDGHGHWGLAGMRERAERIGARLAVWSAPGRGTEVELILPAAVAYRKPGE